MFPARHPKRLMWIEWFARRGHHPQRTMAGYFNSGFVSVPREFLGFLEVWSEMCALVLEHNDGLRHIKTANADDLFHSTDQDAMNFALMMVGAPINFAGPEAMDFAPGGYYLSHAIGGTKPWHGRHIRRALRGLPPSRATRAYYRFANAPVRVFSSFDFRLRNMSLIIAAAIGRFYRRG